MTVIHISRQVDRRTLEVLAELTELALAGRLTGFAYLAEVEAHRPKCGVLGRYEADPILGMGAAGKLWGKLSQIADTSQPKYRHSM